MFKSDVTVILKHQYLHDIRKYALWQLFNFPQKF